MVFTTATVVVAIVVVATIIVGCGVVVDVRAEIAIAAVGGTTSWTRKERIASLVGLALLLIWCHYCEEIK